MSAKGLEKLGSGVHGVVYKLDDENILKIVKGMSLDEIRDEMRISKAALVNGIPTAISYDVVKSEEGYGEIYEMFKAGVLSAEVRKHPDMKEKYFKQFIDIYRQIHSIEISDGKLE